MLTASIKKHIVSDHNKKPTLTIEDLTICVKRGKVIALLGSSGCGKSTLVRLLAKLEAADDGEVKCDGHYMSKPSPKVFVVFQDYSEAVFPWMTVYANLALAFPSGRANADGHENAISVVAKKLDIEPFLDRYPSGLSGGEQQRVQLARALLAKPSYLLLDEPTSSLDLELRRKLLELISEEISSNTFGVLLVTHNIDEAVYLADRIYIGRKVGPKLTLTETVGFGRRATNVGVAPLNKRWGKIYTKVDAMLFPKTST